MTYRIVRKPVMGIYNSLDFEIIKVAKTEAELKSEEQTNIVSKSYVKKDSKKCETIVVSNFSHLKKKKSYLLSERLNTLISYDDYSNYEDFINENLNHNEDINHYDDLYNVDNYDSDESSNDCNELYNYYY